MTKAAALILAAGRGERLGGDLPKPLLLIRGKPILAYVLEAFERSEPISRIVLVVPPGEKERFRAFAAGPVRATKVDCVLAGGDHRQHSLGIGLAEVSEEWVAVHDGVRPFVGPELIARCVEGAVRSAAAVPAIPVEETIKEVSSTGRIIGTPDRARLWVAQTPQCFSTRLLAEALAKADASDFLGTDEASLVERLGAPVEIIPGDRENIKITSPADLSRAEMIAAQRA